MAISPAWEGSRNQHLQTIIVVLVEEQAVLLTLCQWGVGMTKKMMTSDSINKKDILQGFQ
jgi:hypothetical protein